MNDTQINSRTKRHGRERKLKETRKSSKLPKTVTDAVGKWKEIVGTEGNGIKLKEPQEILKKQKKKKIEEKNGDTHKWKAKISRKTQRNEMDRKR